MMIQPLAFDENPGLLTIELLSIPERGVLYEVSGYR